MNYKKSIKAVRLSIKRSQAQKLTAVLVGLIVLLIGYMILQSFAASNYASIQPESSTLSVAQQISDSTASGGKAIQFGPGSINNPTSLLPYRPPTMTNPYYWKPTATNRTLPSEARNRDVILENMTIDWYGNPQIDIPQNWTNGVGGNLIIRGVTFTAGLPPTTGAYQQAIKFTYWNTPPANAPLKTVYMEGNKFLPHPSLKNSDGTYKEGNLDGKYWERMTTDNKQTPNMRFIEQNTYTYGINHTRPSTGGHIGGDVMQISRHTWGGIFLHNVEARDLSYQGWYFEPMQFSDTRYPDGNGGYRPSGDVTASNVLLKGRLSGNAYMWNHERLTTPDAPRTYKHTNFYLQIKDGASKWYPHDRPEFVNEIKVISHSVPSPSFVDPAKLGQGYVSPGYK